jgi:hypothetical protein
VGILLFIAGCSFELDEALDQDNATNFGFASTWTERTSTKPMNTMEELAIQAANEPDKPAVRGNLSASILLYDPPMALVAVQEDKVTRGEKTYIRTLYRIDGYQIVANTFPEEANPLANEEDRQKREEAAREVAFQAKEGTAPSRPLLYYNKYSYYPMYDGACTVTVNEKDTRRVPLATYFIDVCDGK